MEFPLSNMEADHGRLLEDESFPFGEAPDPSRWTLKLPLNRSRGPTPQSAPFLWVARTRTPMADFVILSPQMGPPKWVCRIWGPQPQLDFGVLLVFLAKNGELPKDQRSSSNLQAGSSRRTRRSRPTWGMATPSTRWRSSWRWRPRTRRRTLTRAL